MPVDIDQAADRIREDGYAVVPDFLNEQTVDRLRRGLAPVFDAISSRMDDDYGQQTLHTHNLLAKTRAVDEVLVDDRLLGLIEAVLGPDFQVSGVAAMRPGPGDRRQRMHQDDGHYPIPRPHPPLIVNTLIALDPFTAENGATEVVPGSHRFTERVDPEVPTVTVEMPTGALLLWARGGAPGVGRCPLAPGRRELNAQSIPTLHQCELQPGVAQAARKPVRRRAVGGRGGNAREAASADRLQADRNPIETVRQRLNP